MIKSYIAPPASLLYAYQNARCFYCGKYIKYFVHRGGNKNDEGYTIDHLFPRSKGFRKAGNIVLACRRCNEMKGNRMPTIKELTKAFELYKLMNRKFILES
jgi:5-methylcytosine-specific restriction endonuclease McrA